MDTHENPAGTSGGASEGNHAATLIDQKDSWRAGDALDRSYERGSRTLWRVYARAPHRRPYRIADIHEQGGFVFVINADGCDEFHSFDDALMAVAGILIEGRPILSVINGGMAL